MYEDNEKKIDWLSILKRLITIIVILLLIFGVITLVTKCTRNNNDDDNNKVVEPVDLTDLLNQMQDATLKYITKDNLPTELNASKTIKLKYLINKDLISELKDSNNNVCEENTSYSEITRLENNYAVRIQLNCGQNTDYRIIYIGCFDNCADAEICTGDENTTSGICTIVEETTNNQTNTQTNNNSTSTTTKPSTQTNTSTTKPSTSTTTNNNNSSNNSSTNTNTNTTTKTTTYYEFKKCTYTYGCSNGTLTSDNDCLVESYKTTYGNVISNKKTCASSDYTYNSSTGTCTKTVGFSYKSETKIKYFTSTSALKSEGYTYVGYVKGYGYKGTKTVSTPYCSVGTSNGSACVVTGKVVTLTPYCEDSSFYYNSETNTCSITNPVFSYEPADLIDSTCETTWSASKTLAGWTRTGKTKVE